jgi:hypothetical protein
MKRQLAIAFLVAAVAAPIVHAAPRDHSGFYDNVRYIAEADDYVGVRVGVRQGATTQVEFEVCGGWCNGPETLPATISGDRLTFTFQRRWTGQGGRETIEQVSVAGRFTRGGLILNIGDEPPERLKLRRREP